LHEAGVSLFSAMYGRDFTAENDRLAALDIDARQAGFDVAVVVEATAAIDLDDSRKRMMSDMRRAGINLNATA
jgi:nicotinamidase-related amidase